MAGSTPKNTDTRRAFLHGVMTGAPFLIVVAPFAMLFGVVATEAGLDLAATMGFSALVIAGAAQFTALQLITEDASVAIILLTSLAVNLRMAMYSAALVPWIGSAPLWQRAIVAYANFDQSYAAAVGEYEKRPDLSVPERIAIFFGIAAPIVPAWYAATWAGATIGTTIPDAWALDFALPITFLAMVGPMLKTLPHVAAAGTSILLALVLAGLPAGVGLLVAGVIAMAVGAAVESWQEARG